MKSLDIRILLFVVFVCSAFLGFSQAAPPATPIDGGLGLLLAGGAVYAIKQIRKRK